MPFKSESLKYLFKGFRISYQMEVIIMLFMSFRNRLEGISHLVSRSWFGPII